MTRDDRKFLPKVLDWGLGFGLRRVCKWYSFGNRAWHTVGAEYDQVGY